MNFGPENARLRRVGASSPREAAESTEVGPRLDTAGSRDSPITDKTKLSAAAVRPAAAVRAAPLEQFTGCETRKTSLSQDEKTACDRESRPIPPI